MCINKRLKIRICIYYFNNNKIPELKHNKYIEYTDDIYHKYLNIIEGDINE